MWCACVSSKGNTNPVAIKFVYYSIISYQMCLSSRLVQLLKRPTLQTQFDLGKWGWTDTPTDIPPERGASCVQNFDDSLAFAIRMTYRISLRSSSLWEPRHPLLKVLVTLFLRIRISFHELSNQYFFFSFRKGIDIGLCFLTEARKNKSIDYLTHENLYVFVRIM